MKILTALRNRRKSEQEKAVGTYHEFLSQVDPDDDSPEGQAKLSALLAQFGKTPEEFEADFGFVAEVRTASAVVDGAANADAEHLDAYRAHLAACAARQEAYAMHNEKVRLANNAAEDAVGKVNHRATMSRKLKELEASNPALFNAVIAAKPKKK